jgi:uncharacterized protein with NRDE domain
MCLIVLAHRVHADYSLVLAANRDEYFDRPTAAAAYWPQAPQILAGRDLQGGGTWLGINRQGGWAALTNVREPGVKSGGRSRGLLVSGFLRSRDVPLHYLEHVARMGHRFAGFNLLAGKGSELAGYSNRDAGVRRLSPGIYGLSNRLLDTPWPKVKQAKDQLRKMLHGPDFRAEQLWELLADRQPPPLEDLPQTGVDRDLERALGAIFVQFPGYGTRCSTLLMIGYDGQVRFSERRFDSNGRIAGQSDFVFVVNA